MSWVNQVISAVEAGGKVAWSVLFSCATSLVLEHYFPELFIGLPKWVFPTIRMIAIFSLVLSIAAILPPIATNMRSFWQLICAPIARRSTRKKLLRLHITEVVILCKAIAQADRIIWIKPDMVQTISLQDKGLIRRFPCGVFKNDGTSSFEVPMQVWRVLQSMEEFGHFHHDRFLLTIRSGQSTTEADILACLPQAHPAVYAEQHLASAKE